MVSIISVPSNESKAFYLLHGIYWWLSMFLNETSGCMKGSQGIPKPIGGFGNDQQEYIL